MQLNALGRVRPRVSYTTRTRSQESAGTAIDVTGESPEVTVTLPAADGAAVPIGPVPVGGR